MEAFSTKRDLFIVPISDGDAKRITNAAGIYGIRSIRPTE